MPGTRREALLIGLLLVVAVWAGASAWARLQDDGFEAVNRGGSVDVDDEYDLSGLTIPREEIHTLLPRDAIPALTDPHRQSASEAEWLADDARIISVTVGDETLGVPLAVLDWHEVVNTTVGGQPIAATYCPLCDSATVFSRRVGDEVLEFGVSGALYNSNVLMYDRTGNGLWSQLAMEAVSGPRAGTALDMLPVRLVPFARFRETRPDAEIVSDQTGHQRSYGGDSPYDWYFADDRLLVPVRGMGDALPRKTLGVGIEAAGDAWFVPADALDAGAERIINTQLGAVRVTKTDAGVRVVDAPDAARTAQTFYYSWSAFFPGTEVVAAGAADPTDDDKGED